MASLLFSVLYLTHCCGCIMHYMALIEIDYGIDDTWIHINKLINEPVYVRYINTIYYSVLIMITVGHYPMTSTTEKGFSIVVVLALAGTFAYSLNKIGFILEYMFKSEVELKLNNNVL